MAIAFKIGVSNLIDSSNIVQQACGNQYVMIRIRFCLGDFQRIELYAKLGYQLPQYIPPEVWNAFHALVEMGFDKQLAK